MQPFVPTSPLSLTAIYGHLPRLGLLPETERYRPRGHRTKLNLIGDGLESKADEFVSRELPSACSLHSLP